jgi:hypothetical protein
MSSNDTAPQRNPEYPGYAPEWAVGTECSKIGRLASAWTHRSAPRPAGALTIQLERMDWLEDDRPLDVGPVTVTVRYHDQVLDLPLAAASFLMDLIRDVTGDLGLRDFWRSELAMASSAKGDEN